jgi:transcriptional regulator GlxA family with amidase domain
VRLKPPKKGPISVVFVVGNGATVIDFAGPWEVFQDVSVPGNDSPFSVAMISDNTAPLRASGGMIIAADHSYDTLTEQPNIIVMGAQGEHTPKKIAWIKKVSEKADIVMSVCTGAFLLAKTGMLDGLTATTHHDFYDQFEKQFPAIHLIRGPRYVENGKVATAGGLTSGIELALRVVQRYFGDTITEQTAAYMEYNRSPRRPNVIRA